MYVKVKINEDQDFKDSIVARIKQELHEVIKNDLNDIVKNRIETELDKRVRFDNLQIIADNHVKEFLSKRVKQVYGDSSWTSSKLDAHIKKLIDEMVLTRLESLFTKRFEKTD